MLSKNNCVELSIFKAYIKGTYFGEFGGLVEFFVLTDLPNYVLAKISSLNVYKNIISILPNILALVYLCIHSSLREQMWHLLEHLLEFQTNRHHYFY